MSRYIVTLLNDLAERRDGSDRYVAWDDYQYREPIVMGYGATELDAVQDLIDQLRKLAKEGK